MKNLKIKLLLSSLVLILVLISAITWTLFSAVVNGTREDKFIFKIKRGMSYSAIVRSMLDNKILKNKMKLVATAKMLGYKNKIKAGRYEIIGGSSSYGLLRQLVDGKVKMEWITIPEGKQARQIASILKKRIELDSTSFMQFVTDKDYAKKLGIPAHSLEGFLFPDTYGFFWGMDSESIIKIMVSQFKKQFTDSLKAKTRELGFSVQEIVTLASIIEGEAVLNSEREIISAVYHNRLKKGIPLQADPSIQYIIKDGPRRLLKKDLKIESPYNTYKYSGLPPGPINNPGIASIRASLYPAPVKYLYFVANGDGSHTFSTTFREHLKAKARFDQYRKKIKQKKQSGENGAN